MTSIRKSIKTKVWLLETGGMCSWKESFDFGEDYWHWILLFISSEDKEKPLLWHWHLILLLHAVHSKLLRWVNINLSVSPWHVESLRGWFFDCQLRWDEIRWNYTWQQCCLPQVCRWHPCVFWSSSDSVSASIKWMAGCNQVSFI